MSTAPHVDMRHPSLANGVETLDEPGISVGDMAQATATARSGTGRSPERRPPSYGRGAGDVTSARARARRRLRRTFQRAPTVQIVALSPSTPSAAPGAWPTSNAQYRITVTTMSTNVATRPATGGPGAATTGGGGGGTGTVTNRSPSHHRTSRLAGSIRQPAVAFFAHCEPGCERSARESSAL
jgi:hypothetical protein